MTEARDQRVEHALDKLIGHTLPIYPDEDEATADERLDEAFNIADEIITNAPECLVAPDVNHISDLIRRKLIQENDRPDEASKFNNLFSRLLTQPVLSQKWAMLHFLHKLSNSDSPQYNLTVDEVDNLRPNDIPTYGDADRKPTVSPLSSFKAQPTRHNELEDPAFSEAFSNPGLARLPATERRQQPQPREGKRERPREQRDSAEPVESGAKAEAQQQLRAMQPSEPALLRDLPFTLQGLSSTNLTFSSKTTLKLPPTLPVPLISLLHTLAEPSLLYRGLSEFVESSGGGLVGQSFRSALGIELRAYLGLVATLEGQIRRALAMLDDSQPRQGIGKAGVTLRRCVIWTREATMGLRLMSLMVEESSGKKGGQLISLIHSFSLTHGDPFVQAFAERLLSHVTRPFYDMLRTWIYDGELSDPYEEFFVSEPSPDAQNDNGDDKGAATSVWEDKYKLNRAMIPTIITEEFANKVFLIGKSLNFIRYGCGDPTWVESYSKSTSRELRYGDTANLGRSIGEAYKTTMARLISLMSDKFHLFEHLQALKRYLLLGAGDFIAVLMESLSANLDRPANTQYRHMLTAQLEHAVRNSNAQFDGAEVLRRLDARMLELSHGEIGWDVFTLEYKIDAPVDVIVTAHGSKQYLKVFNFLWRVKRVEFALGSTWRRCMTGARGVLAQVDDKVGKDWKKARCSIAEMIHFVNQLQYYILFEVIESSWHELQKSLRKPESTLDDMIQAHAEYLKSITRKGLLGSGSIDFTGQLHELLKIMLAYKDVVDGLYSFSVAEFTRRQEASARIENRTAAGKWGVTERDDDSPTPGLSSANRAKGGKTNKTGGLLNDRDGDNPSPFPMSNAALQGSSEEDVLAALRVRLTSLSADFKSRVCILLGDLAHQPDVDMRWLGMVMNFNSVYEPVKRKRRTKDPAGGQTVARERSGRDAERVKADRGKENVVEETPRV